MRISIFLYLIIIGRKGQTTRQQRTDDNGADGRESPVTELLGSMNEGDFYISF